MKFTIAIEPRTRRTAFGVVVPDLPGCFSAGNTVEEAFDNAREAIELHCEMLAEAGQDPPEPRPMSDWQSDREYAGWTWGIVDVAVERYFSPAEKINIAGTPPPQRRFSSARHHASLARYQSIVAAMPVSKVCAG